MASRHCARDARWPEYNRTVPLKLGIVAASAYLADSPRTLARPARNQVASRERAAGLAAVRASGVSLGYGRP